ncbi:MAG: Nif3-like dinuclear metal center hexameric protein [Clostridia bacterium]|nr:Nif3-like dinuclear metal center hexameric protein [Clostridia bacterium]
MLLKDFLAVMESIAPRELALDYDNPGLIVGTEKNAIKKVLIALDCTTEVADEAKALGCDLVVTHHPLLFRAVKRICPDDPLSAPVFRLIKNGVGMFAAHTNLDSAEGGVNTTLCRLLGIRNETPVPPENLARAGELDEAISFSALAERVEKTLETKVRLAGPERPVKRVMVVGGSGGSEYAIAREVGADVLLTGECRHNEAIEAVAAGVNVIAAGHYETESVVLEPLKARLTELTSGVEYVISKAGNPLRTLR